MTSVNQIKAQDARNCTKLSRQRYNETNKRYIVFVCAFMNHFMFGGFNAMMSVIFVDIVRAFDAKRSEASLLQSLSRGFSFGGGVIGEFMMRKLGVGQCIAGGTILASICLFASAFANTITMIVILVGVGTGFGLMMPLLSTHIAIERAFDSLSFPKYMAYTVAGAGAGQIILPYMAEIMLEAYGWQGTFMLMSGIFLHMVIFALLTGLNLPYNKDPVSDKKKKYKCEISILKNVSYLMVLFINIPYGITGFFESWYVPDYLVTIGYTREQGSILLTVVGAASTFGRTLAGLVHPICVYTKTKIIYHWVYTFLLLAVAHVMFPLFPNYEILFSASILYGTLFGMIRSQMSPIIAEAVGRINYPFAVALGNTVYGIFSSIGGVVAGALVDSTGSYDMVFYVAAILSVSCAISAGILIVKDTMTSTTCYKRDGNVEITHL